MNRRTQASSAIAAVLNEIESNIASGAWAPGYRLPTERELEERFGVARNTVRKGLKRLEKDGKIIRHVGRGSFVAEQPSPPQKAYTLSEQVMGASPAEIMEVRLMLEPHAAQLAALRASAADLRHLDECLEQAAIAPDLLTFEHWDGQLHQTIIAAARNELLDQIYRAINGVRNQPEWIKLKERTVSPAHRAAYHNEHSELVRALRERDGDLAKQLMFHHLVEVRNNLLGL